MLFKINPKLNFFKFTPEDMAKFRSSVHDNEPFFLLAIEEAELIEKTKEWLKHFADNYAGNGDEYASYKLIEKLEELFPSPIKE